jgi:hypothetical protein
MSSAQNLPNRTRILIQDLLFREKYNLSHSQTDLMAYLVNVLYWAINVDGYFVIATSKIMMDLPAMGEKTIEASFKVLRDLELIQCKIVHVTQLRGKPYLRGIKLTKKGKEYNDSLVLPAQDKRVIELQKENKILKNEKRELVERNIKLEAIMENLGVSDLETPTPKKEIIEPTPTPNMPTKQAIDFFVDDVKIHFKTNSKPICNGVPKWNKETTFYINSYNNLSIITPTNDYRQLKNPLEINQFWEWLSTHTHRVGDKINFAKTPTIKEIEKRFLNQKVMIGGGEEKICELVQIENGLNVKVKNKNGEVRTIIDNNTKKDMFFTLKRCQDILFGLLV